MEVAGPLGTPPWTAAYRAPPPTGDSGRGPGGAAGFRGQAEGGEGAGEENKGPILRRRWDHVVFLELRRHSRVTTGISAFILGCDQEGRRGPDVVVPGTSVFSSSQTGVSRNF